MTEVATLPDHSQTYQPTGLVLRRDLSFQEWAAIGETLDTMHRALNWWIGDWLNYGEANYGEKYTQAIQETGREPQTLMNLAWVASRFEISRRREILSWSHHAEVAGLDPALADKLLDQAEQNRWSVRALREAVQREKNAIVANVQPLGGGIGSDHGDGVETNSHSVDQVEEGEWEYVEPDGESEAAESGEDGDLTAQLATELEESHREIQRLQTIVQSIEADDPKAEIARWAEKYARLEGHLQRQNAKLAEAERIIRAQRRILDEARRALNVPSNSDIVPAIRDLLR